MSNGVAYVLDENGMLSAQCNLEMVAVTELDRMDDRRLRTLIRRHYHKTGSGRAKVILERWIAYRALFRRVAPGAFTSASPRIRSPVLGA